MAGEHVGFAFPVNRRLPGEFRVTSPLFRGCLAEFLGTAFFLTVGIGNVVQWRTSNGALDSWFSLNICWGFAVTFGLYLCAPVTGGHLNPAVSLCLWTLGKINLVTALCYSVAQTLGAFVGTAIAYFTYLQAIDRFDGGHRVAEGENGTLCFLTTCPQEWTNFATGLFDQIVGTGILLVAAASFMDPRNRIPIFMHPLLGGFVVMMIGMCYGQNDGYPINPARDFGARLFAACIFGSEAFTFHNHWFWVPIVGPLLGAIVGAWVYNLVSLSLANSNSQFIDYHTFDSKKDTFANPITVSDSSISKEEAAWKI